MFDKSRKIISFEPNKNLFTNLKKTQKHINNFKFYLYGGLNKKIFSYLFVPYFNNYCLDSLASVEKKFVLNSVKRGIFHKEILKKITIKKTLCEFVRIDDFELKPCFIKIDTEGSEHLVLKGLSNTIKKNKPLIMLEKNDLNFSKVKKILNNINYNIYSFKNENLKKYVFKKKEHLNLICIHKKNSFHLNFCLK